MKRKCFWLLLALALCLMLAACGTAPEESALASPTQAPAAPVETAGPATPEPAPTEEPTPEPTEEPEDPAADALEQYRVIVGQADTYQYDPYAEPSGNYRYALVQMQPEDTIPTLLLEQETTDYLYYALVFRYDPQSKTVTQAEGSLMEGSSPIGGFRGGLAMQGDGNGIRVTEMSAGTGMTDIYRVTLDGNALKTEEQWSGMMDSIPAELGFIEIEWHEVGDMVGLESWTPGEAPQPEPAAPAQTGAEAPLPEDGDNIVLAGTLNEYTYEQTVELQGVPDPNAGWTDTSMTYWIVVLDEPQTIEIGEGAGPGYRAGETFMISVLEPAGLEAYAGQHLIFSIDPETSWWQSDTSLPMGAARARSIKILN